MHTSLFFKSARPDSSRLWQSVYPQIKAEPLGPIPCSKAAWLNITSCYAWFYTNGKLKIQSLEKQSDKVTTLEAAFP